MANPSIEPTTLPGPAAKRDFRQEVTDNIVALLEKGVAPWQKPWDAQARAAMPTNPTTEKPYRGGNAVHLLAVGLQKNYEDPRWLTYKQAAEEGWQVRKGEKGTQIEFWDVKPAAKRVNVTADPEKADNQPESRLVHRVYTVFNASQIDGISPYVPKANKPFEVIEAGERILNASGAKVSHDQADSAQYNRRTDSIHLPPKDAFRDAAAYYGTALHELAHWTGHPDRLNRPTLTNSYRFGDQNYAREELRAELASVFIAAEKGIPHNPESHAAYVGSWIQTLKQDKHEIFRAAHDASRATDFLNGLERETSIADQKLGLGVDASAGTSGGANLRDAAANLDRTRDEIGEAADDLTPTVPDKDISPDGRTATQDRENGIGDPVSPGAAKSIPAAFREAESITSERLGQSAKTYPARTSDGIYRGTVIGETPDLFVQRLSPKSAIAHPKELFDQPPGVGSRVTVQYSNAKPLVREIRQRDKAQELAR